MPILQKYFLDLHKKASFRISRAVLSSQITDFYPNSEVLNSKGQLLPVSFSINFIHALRMSEFP